VHFCLLLCFLLIFPMEVSKVLNYFKKNLINRSTALDYKLLTIHISRYICFCRSNYQNIHYIAIKILSDEMEILKMRVFISPV
jgi:hypothetical protein